LRPLRLIIALAVVVLGVVGSVSAQTCTHYASPNGGGNGLSQGSPFRIVDFVNSSPQPGNVLCLLDGTYTSGLELGATPSGAPGNPITMRALNEGGAYINGQDSNRVLFFNGTSYWTVIGIDFGNGGSQFDGVASITDAHHITFQRVCVFNTITPWPFGIGSNSHTFGLNNSHDNVFEDVCVFGQGRNSFIMFEDGTKNNVFRRFWLRWDGYPDNNGGTCSGGTLQVQYHTHHTNDIYENFISIFSGGQYAAYYTGPNDPNHFNGFPCPSFGAGWGTRGGLLDPALPGAQWLGYIGYGYPDHSDLLGTNEHVGLANRWGNITFRDIFMDGRYGQNGHKVVDLYACDLTDPNDGDRENGIGGDCSRTHEDRITSLRNPGQPVSTMAPSGADATNLMECTSLAACPNFYTGSNPGTGSRSCFEYQNGTLTSTPLWPWRMDDRIKQALARSGIGPSLSGSAGPGYAANTVTSEIVARYGAVPAQCSRAAVAGVPAITSPLTATGSVGTAFSYQITASNSPTSYGATGLPGGLSVSTSTGLISGTPSAGGTFSVTLSATNASGTGTATLTLTITTGTVPAITSPLTATGSIVAAFSYQITATNSPTSYGASGLPGGLSVSTTTGLISGTPAAAGTFAVTLSASNASGTGTATLTLTITTTPTPTPNAWWKFDDNGGTSAADATGNGHTLTLNAGAGWGAPKIGVAALRCNGSTNPPSTADSVFNNPQYTWMGWLRSDTDPSNTLFQAPIANGQTNVGTDAWGLWWSSQDAAGTTVQTIFHTDSGGAHRFKIPVALVAHTWYHLAATYDGTTVQVYLNGQSQGSFAAGTPVAPSGSFQVCGRYFPTPWAGDLDEWQILDHPLSAAQILTDYQRGAATNRRRAHKLMPQ
jgi:hypothetical protein